MIEQRTTEQMMLPVYCPRHSHAGYGVAKEHVCPWCEIERLKGLLAEATGLLILVQENVRSVELMQIYAGGEPANVNGRIDALLKARVST